MCGIQGFFDRRSMVVDGRLAEKMGCAIEHRGPDDSGVFAGPGVAIGNMRLSIIDLESGHQPMVSEDGKVAVVQNGEIYNYVELKAELEGKGHVFDTHSDTEVLLRMYLEYGEGFVDRLVGMFGVAIWDGRVDELRIYRDTVGVKPMFLWDDGERLLFGSEIKAILAAGIPRAMCDEALHHFLSFGYVPPPYTLFEGVRHLMPGHFVVVTREGIEVKQWWDPTRFEARPYSENEFKERFIGLLDESVRLRMRADVPFGAFLSGGLDSSSVVGLMQRHTDHAVKTFSIGFHDERFDESAWSKIASERFGTEHYLEFVGPEVVEKWSRAVYHCDQPHSDVSFLPTMRLSELAVSHVKMVLTGDGGDELFGGYTKYSGFFARHGLELGQDEFVGLYHDHISLFSEAEKLDLYTEAQAKKAGGRKTVELTKGLVEKVPHWDRINQALWLDVALLLPGNNLVKPDRMAMSVSLEARDPFLDKALSEFAFTVPGDLKVRGDETRYGYKLAVRELLGDDLTYRAKRMFTVPIGEWFKDVLSGFTRSVLHSDRFLDRGMFRREKVEQMVEEHESGRVDHTRQIRLLLALEMWQRMYLDSDELRAPTMDELAADLGATNPIH